MGSTKTKKSTKKSKKKLEVLELILLIMEPKTRRFELIQLEFKERTLTKDVLAKIPKSITEEALIKQTYTGLCNCAGQELSSSVYLREILQESLDVLIAMPDNIDGKECARLAKPILTNKSVLKMLKSVGIDTENLFNEATMAKKENTRKNPVLERIPSLVEEEQFADEDAVGGESLTGPAGKEKADKKKGDECECVIL